MARKPRSTKNAKKSTRRSGGDLPVDRIVDAALDEAAAGGWRTLSLAGIAERARLPLGEVLLATPTKASVLARFLERIDRLTFGPVTKPDMDDKPRDRLFEVMMRRFDALNRNRDGARAIIRGVACDPAALLVAGLSLRRVPAAMLAAADIPADGIRGCLLVKGTRAVFLGALRAWLNDDSPDLAKTMAVLDRGLSRAERLFSLLPGGRRRNAPAS